MKHQLPIFTKRLPNIQQAKPIHRSSATKRRHKLPSAVIQRTRINSPSLSTHEVLHLQRTVGNRKVRGLIVNIHQDRTAAFTVKPAIQTKLTIGPAGDKYEQEADRMAHQVVQGIELATSSPAGKAIQRQDVPEEEELQMKRALQRRAADDHLQHWQQLSPRERDIAALTCLGYTNRQIAGRLYISPETVKTHMRNLLQKFDVRSKSELRRLLADWDFSAWENRRR